jgi:hypothetical protein
MTGLQRVARRAIVARMKGHAGLTALVPATSIFAQTVPANPAWPFVKTGVPQKAPITATCLNGGEVTVPVDGFAKDRYAGQQKVETAEDHADRIGAEIEAALHLKGETVTIDGAPVRLTYRLTDIRTFPDGAEAGAYHYSALVRARVFAE